MKNQHINTVYYNLILEENYNTEAENIIKKYDPLNIEDAKELLQLQLIKDIMSTFNLSSGNFFTLFNSSIKIPITEDTNNENTEFTFKFNDKTIENYVISVENTALKEIKKPENSSKISLFKYLTIKNFKLLFYITIIALCTIWGTHIYKKVTTHDNYDVNVETISATEKAKEEPSAINVTNAIRVNIEGMIKTALNPTAQIGSIASQKDQEQIIKDKSLSKSEKKQKLTELKQQTEKEKEKFNKKTLIKRLLFTLKHSIKALQFGSK